MLFSAVSILVVAQSNSEIPEGLMNNPVFAHISLPFTPSDQADEQSTAVKGWVRESWT